MLDGANIAVVMGAGFSAIAVMFGAALTFIAKISENHSNREIKALEAQQEEEAQLRSEVKELRTDTRQLRKELGETDQEVVKLRSTISRQFELISAATPVMLWVHHGATPPTPHVPLLWQHHLRSQTKNDS